VGVQEEAEGRGQGLGVCPRCGRPIDYVERHRRGGRVYIYAVHYEGYVNGRPRLVRHYLGPEGGYRYVTATHADLGLELRGLNDPDRVEEYLRSLAEAVTKAIGEGRLNASQALELARAIRGLSRLVKRLEEYAGQEGQA
jgi:hypothetical protein